MSQFILDIFFSSIFALFLVFLFKIKERTFAENKESFKYIVSGISILLLVSTVRLIDHQEIFFSTKIISDMFYKDLVEVIGVVAGITLLIAGVAIWIPSRKRSMEDLTEKYELSSKVRDIEKYIIYNDSINELFENIPEAVCDAFGFVSAAVFRFQKQSSSLICTNRFHTSNKFPSGFTNIDTFNRFETDSIDVFRKRLRADYTMIIKLGGNTGAVVIFWSEKKIQLEPEQYSLLDYIGRIMSLKLESRLQNLKMDFYSNGRQYVRAVYRLAARKDSFENRFKKIHGIFKAALGTEFITLAIFDNKYDFRRYSAGLKSNILLEKGARPALKDSIMELAVGGGKSIIFDDISAMSPRYPNDLINNCNQKSIMIFPIQLDDRLVGVLQVGHSQAGYFSRSDAALAEIMSSALTPVIQAEINLKKSKRQDKYLASIAAFDDSIDSLTGLDSLYERAAEILMDNIMTTAVRISEYDNSTGIIRPMAIKCLRSDIDLNLSATAIDESDTACHHDVVKEQRPLLINQDDRETSIDSLEASILMVPDMQSGFIVPIIVNGFTIGVISLAEMRQSNRFGYDASMITFCREIANKIANAIKVYKLSEAVVHDRFVPANSSGLEYNSRLLDELKSPITNIRGSIDILKMKNVNPKGVPKRVLESLEKSTRELVSLVSRDT